MSLCAFGAVWRRTPGIPSTQLASQAQFFQKALIAFVGACTHIHSRCLSTTCAYGTRRSAQTQGSRTLEDLHLAGPVAPKSQIQGIPSEESGSRLPHNPHNPHNPDDHLVSSVLGTCFALSTYFSLVDASTSLSILVRITGSRQDHLREHRPRAHRHGAGQRQGAGTRGRANAAKGYTGAADA